MQRDHEFREWARRGARRWQRVERVMSESGVEERTARLVDKDIRIADKDQEIGRLVSQVDTQRVEIAKLIELLAKAKPGLIERIRRLLSERTS